MSRVFHLLLIFSGLALTSAEERTQITNDEISGVIECLRTFFNTMDRMCADQHLTFPNWSWLDVVDTMKVWLESRAQQMASSNINALPFVPEYMNTARTCVDGKLGTDLHNKQMLDYVLERLGEALKLNQKY